MNVYDVSVLAEDGDASHEAVVLASNLKQAYQLVTASDWFNNMTGVEALSIELSHRVVINGCAK